ncbi:MAG: hypothetical protein KF770_22935 [Anaerolineae bacterium]|nr:hypothetical protein [Anaerolineae bacterium]
MANSKRLSVSDQLYERIRELAKIRGQSVEDLLAAAFSLAETVFWPTADLADPATQEQIAYLAQHHTLMSQYAGQYVAIYHGQLIDHDPDFTALYQRIDPQYPDEFVLMKQVRPLPEPMLRNVSFRLIRDDT